MGWNVSAKVEYACMAMLDLAAMERLDRPVQQKRMADRHDIPAQFLVQILQQLKAAGLVVSTRGALGGYQLARSADTITLWDVVAAVQGDADRDAFQNRSSLAANVLRGVWQNVSVAERAVLQETTLAQLARRMDIASEPMYFI